MRTIQQVLTRIMFTFVLGIFPMVVMAQPLTEFAISIPGFWGGIDPKDGSMNQLSIVLESDPRGGGGGGGGAGVFQIVGASTYFDICESSSDGQGVAEGTATVRNGMLVSDDWTVTCRGGRSMTSTQRFIVNRTFSRITMPLPDRDIIFFRLSDRHRGLGLYGHKKLR